MANSVLHALTTNTILNMTNSLQLDGIHIPSAEFKVVRTKTAFYPVSFIPNFTDVKLEFVTDKTNRRNKTETCFMIVNIYYNHGKKIERLNLVTQCTIEKVRLSELDKIDNAMSQALYSFTRGVISSQYRRLKMIPFEIAKLPQTFDEINQLSGKSFIQSILSNIKRIPSRKAKAV